MKYIVNQNVINYALSENEQVLYDSENEKLLVINHCGALVWQQLDYGATVQQIIQEVQKTYGETDAEKVKKDVLYYIDSLNEIGFLYIKER